MWSVLQYLNALLSQPGTRLVLLLTFLVATLAAGRIARVLRWSVFGTWLTIAGLGGAFSVTFASRLLRLDLTWQPTALIECLDPGRGGPSSAEALLNLGLLFPLGLGLYLTRHRFALSAAGVVTTTLVIEFWQAVTGLGTCQASDLLRNSFGGLLGVLLGWLVLGWLGDDRPVWLGREGAGG